MGNRAERLRRAFVAALEAEMAKQSISERGLSDKLGKHKNFINDVLHDQYVLKFEDFVEISEALGVHPLDMLARVLHS